MDIETFEWGRWRKSTGYKYFLPNKINTHGNGIIHYQFETIHPFLDGDGRVGRLLVILYLVNKGMMDKPLLYLSKFFEHNKQVYYDNLMRVRNNNDMIHWLRHCLIGIRDTAIGAADTISLWKSPPSPDFLFSYLSMFRLSSTSASAKKV